MYDLVMEQTAVAPYFEAYPSDEVLEDAGNASSKALGPAPPTAPGYESRFCRIWSDAGH